MTAGASVIVLTARSGSAMSNSPGDTRLESAAAGESASGTTDPVPEPRAHWPFPRRTSVCIFLTLFGGLALLAAGASIPAEGYAAVDSGSQAIGQGGEEDPQHALLELQRLLDGLLEDIATDRQELEDSIRRGDWSPEEPEKLDAVKEREDALRLERERLQKILESGIFKQ